MVYRGIPGGTFLLIAINILAGTLIDAFPHGYARPSEVKGAGAGAGMPYGEGAPPSAGGEYPNGKGGNGQYYGMKGAMPPAEPAPVQPSAGGYGGNGGRGEVSYGRPSYS